MIRFILVLSIFLAGCPKKNRDTRTVSEIEREQKIKELLSEDDEFFEGIPESGEEEDEDQ
jgi:hypothetical protein